MSETASQTVSCGILNATEMVLTRIWMIFAGRVAEPHSVACIALTNIVQARVRASRAALWAFPSSIFSTACCTLATAGAWSSLATSGMGRDLWNDSPERPASLRSAVAGLPAAGADGLAYGADVVGKVFRFSWMRAVRSASL